MNFKYTGQRNASIVDKKGNKVVIAPNTVVEVVQGRVNATLTVYGKKVVTDLSAAISFVKKCTATKLKPTAKDPNASATSLKPKATTAKPADSTVKPSKPPKPEGASPAAAEPDYKWFKFNGARAKSFTTPRGKKVPIKVGTIFGLLVGKKSTSVFVPSEKAKFNVADAAAEGLRKSAAPYRGKVPGLEEAAAKPVRPTSVKPAANESGLYFEDSNPSKKPKVKITAAELKDMLGTSKLPFSGPIAKVVMKRAFDNGVLDDMKKYLQRQKAFLDCADSVQSLIVKWKPEGRFLPTGSGKEIIINLNDEDLPMQQPRTSPSPAPRPPRQPRVTHEPHGYEHFNTPGVEIRPRASKTPIIVNLNEDEDDDWGDSLDKLHPTDDDLRNADNLDDIDDIDDIGNLDDDDLDDIDQSILDRLDEIEASAKVDAMVSKSAVIFIDMAVDCGDE